MVASTDEETVKSSVKTFLKKTKLRVALIVATIVLLIAALSVGGFFAAASIKASSNSAYDKSEAVEICKKWIADTHEGVKISDIIVEEADRDLALHHGFSRAYYEYDIELIYQGVEYEFWVDSTDGEVRLVDRD